jgi:hypothetical protein
MVISRFSTNIRIAITTGIFMFVISTVAAQPSPAGV